MSYILDDIVTRVQQRVRDTGYSSTEIKSYINDAQNDVFNEYRLPFMQTSQNYTLAVGQSDITNGVGLPANYVQFVDFMLTTAGQESHLTYVDVTTIDQGYPDVDDTLRYAPGVPTEIYAYANTLRVRAVPDRAYTSILRYYKKPTLLNAGTSVPELPSEFEELLVVGAAYRVLQVKDNYDQAGILQNKYDEILQKLVVKYSQPQVGKPLTMRINRRAVGKTSY